MRKMVPHAGPSSAVGAYGEEGEAPPCALTIERKVDYVRSAATAFQGESQLRARNIAQDVSRVCSMAQDTKKDLRDAAA